MSEEARFLGPLILRVVNDSGGRALFVVEQPFSFYSAKFGRTFTVPAGLETDGPSIPAILVPLIGGNPGLRAAVLHDYLVRALPLDDRTNADEIFYEALLVCGVEPIVAQNMYLAVRGYSSQLQNEARGWVNNNSETYGSSA